MALQAGEKTDNVESAFQTRRTMKKPSATMEAELLRMGNNIITKFHVLMRISQIYDSKNTALIQFVQESLQAINQWIKKEGILSILVDRELFLNGERLHVCKNAARCSSLIVSWGKRTGISSIYTLSTLSKSSSRSFFFIATSF